ncbi:MAG: hypothetical protein ACHQQS_01235 [Thermoanaerobaculales bacterium]
MSSVDPVERFERWLEELARKWERFFARDPQVPLPPERERAALDRRLKEMSQRESRSSAEQFRLEQLLHRFATYNQLWQRMLREREEARAASGAAVRALNVQPPAPVPDNGEEYQRVFARYTAALGQKGKPAAVNFARFRDVLEKQRYDLESQGAKVEGFDVVEDGPNVKVRARVRRGRQG